MKNAEHILILRFSALGDVAIMIPIIRCFFIQYSEVKLTIVTDEKFFGLFKEFNKINLIANQAGMMADGVRIFLNIILVLKHPSKV